VCKTCNAYRHAQQVRACITGQVGKAELLEPKTAVLDIIVVNVTGTGPQAVKTSCDEKWRKGWRRLLLGEDLGKLAKGGGDYSRRKPGRSSQKVAATSPGDVAGDAPRPCPDLRREIFPES